ncbi:hypothetical protein V2J09_011117 [Rumex salicifolius]
MKRSFLFFSIGNESPRCVAAYLGSFWASQAEWIDHNGVFLLSNYSTFGFGFCNDAESSSYSLVVSHLISQKVIWTANRNLVVGSSDKFLFGTDGNTYLGTSAGVVWSTNTTGAKPKAMMLDNSGNLIMLDQNGTILWQSFDHPTDTLISGQRITEGVRLESVRKKELTSYLEIKSGDVILYLGYDNGPQVYWSMSKETRKAIEKVDGKVLSATIVANSWNFYDQTNTLVWQFNISKEYNASAIWTAVLSHDGSIQFFNLEGKANFAQPVKIPQTSCSIPLSCDPFEICSDQCRCPSALSSYPFCKPPVNPLCNVSKASVELNVIGDGFDYSAIGYVPPQLNTSLDDCKRSCLGNCSCNALFFDNGTNSCYLFDQIGSLQQANVNETGYTLVIKLANSGLQHVGSKGSSFTTIMVTIIVVALVVIFFLSGAGFWYRRRRRRLSENVPEKEEAEESFFEGIGGLPVRYKFNHLKAATKDFFVKLGQGGFGSVYLGVEEDGTKFAVKKLEGVGQGSKEFRAEVNIIGSIHHVHLVKLKGFCAEGAHRLLVYEYMGNGSLDRWIFNSNGDLVLDWEKRYSIALGTAKGLAYLHEECEAKIIHCDIKPENVLLDDHFVAKVSDFGLAKLVNREQSYVMTTLRGRRGYLAPEWITNCLISEKSDVYSYGMLLLEMVGGRKNYEPEMNSETSYFPSYAFKKMEEGRLIDSNKVQ